MQSNYLLLSNVIKLSSKLASLVYKMPTKMTNAVDTAMKRFGLLKIVGFAPFSVVNGKSVTKLSDVLIFVTNLSICALFLGVLFKFKENFRSSSIEIINQGNFATYASALMMVAFFFVVFFIFRHQIWKIVLLFHEIDQKLQTNEPARDSYVNAFPIAFGVMVLVAIPLSYYVYSMDLLIMKAILYLYCGIYYVISIGTTSAFLSSKFLRIRTINIHLEAMLAKPQNSFKKSVLQDIDEIEKLTQAYAMVIEINKLINLVFGIPILLGYGLMFFHTIFTTFLACIDLKNQGYIGGIPLGK